MVQSHAIIPYVRTASGLYALFYGLPEMRGHVGRRKSLSFHTMQYGAVTVMKAPID